MNTVIVPVDFSETSLNAARYAGQLLTGHYGVNMILYHVYEKPAHAEGSKEYLENLKEELQKEGSGSQRWPSKATILLKNWKN